MGIVDFKAVGQQAADLRQHALDSELWAHVNTLKEVAAKGKPKNPDNERLEIAQLRIVAYTLQTEAANLETVANQLFAMVGELPDEEPAAATDEPTASGGMPLKDAYKHAAKDSPPHTPGTPADPGASDGAAPRDWLASLPRAKSGSDKITTLSPGGRSAMDKLLGRFK